MMSASAISAAIRAKKKKMEDEESGAVKLSGIPEDAQDIMVNKNHEEGEMLSENVPKEHDEDPMASAEMGQEKKPEPHEMEEPDSDRVQMMAEGGEVMKMDEGGNVLDAEARAHIAPHNFALPGGRYPIHDVAHARNALARVAQHGSPEEQEKVHEAVHRKYPSIGESHADGGEIAMRHAKIKSMLSRMGK